MIQLGLRRAAQLFGNNPQPWQAVHVAGTNGKGTVCTYLSAMLHASGIRCGRFTSPHLIDRWDCITIDEKPVSEALFRQTEEQVLQRNREENIEATEFELLTATAFDIFTKENVQVGVVEVGMGGRDDATNILKSKALTIITNIGLDHQAFLGTTVEEIARHKCGIFVKGVPVIYNRTNQPSVIDVIKEEAKRVGAGPIWSFARLPSLGGSQWKRWMQAMSNQRQQRIGVGNAHMAFKHIYNKLVPKGKQRPSSKLNVALRDTIMNTPNPGRMQWVDIESLVPGAGKVFLDGAHNAQAAECLARVAQYLTGLRQNEYLPISWVIAQTTGRDVREYLQLLLEPGDRIAAVEFGPVDGMPWVKPTPSSDIISVAKGLYPSMDTEAFGADIQRALDWAVTTKKMPVVVTGSLYLAGDLLRKLRDTSTE